MIGLGFYKVCGWLLGHTTMTIKFVEFFIYIKILHVIVKINTVTLEVVPLEFNTLGPSVSPIAGSNPGIQLSVPSGVGSPLFNFLHCPPVLVLHIFFDSEECPEVIWSQIWQLSTMSHHYGLISGEPFTDKRTVMRECIVPVQDPAILLKHFKSHTRYMSSQTF